MFYRHPLLLLLRQKDTRISLDFVFNFTSMSPPIVLSRLVEKALLWLLILLVHRSSFSIAFFYTLWQKEWDIKSGISLCVFAVENSRVQCSLSFYHFDTKLEKWAQQDINEDRVATFDIFLRLKTYHGRILILVSLVSLATKKKKLHDDPATSLSSSLQNTSRSSQQRWSKCVLK